MGSQFRVIEVRFFWGVETEKHFRHKEEAKKTPKRISRQKRLPESCTQKICVLKTPPRNCAQKSAPTNAPRERPENRAQKTAPTNTPRGAPTNAPTYAPANAPTKPKCLFFAAWKARPLNFPGAPHAAGL